MSTQVLRVDPFEPEADKIRLAAEILRGGGLVAFPTETVYGLGANSNDMAAVDRVYEVKHRPREKQLLLHIADVSKVYQYAASIPQEAYKLMHRFWPGPVSIVLRAKSGGTVGFRFPRNQVAYALLREANVPVVAPSANLSGQTPPKTAAEVLSYLSGKIEVVLDGGKTALGIESTIVDLTGDMWKVVREGTVTPSAVRKTIEAKIIIFVCTGNTCRSVVASSLLKKAMRDREDVEVLSAGVAAIPGAGASAMIMDLLRDYSCDVSGHIARRLTDEMVRMADWIFVMEERHKEHILEKIPEAAEKVQLLREFRRAASFGPGEDADIADPIGRDLDYTRACVNLIRKEIERIQTLL